MAKRGTEHHSGKLDEAKVRAIRASQKTLEELGEEFGVSYVSIWKAKHWVTWKWLDPERNPYKPA